MHIIRTMKKTPVKKPKLELKRNTVKPLTTDQLENVAGGQLTRPKECTCAASGCYDM